jgi:hypothetical protein
MTKGIIISRLNSSNKAKEFHVYNPFITHQQWLCGPETSSCRCTFQHLPG